MLWAGSLFILIFCWAFPLPFHAPAVGLGAGEHWVVMFHPSCGLWRLWFGNSIQLCVWDQTAMLFVTHEREGDTHGSLKDVGLSLGVARTIDSPMGEQLATACKPFWGSWWLMWSTQCLVSVHFFQSDALKKAVVGRKMPNSLPEVWGEACGRGEWMGSGTAALALRLWQNGTAKREQGALPLVMISPLKCLFCCFFFLCFHVPLEERLPC